MLQSAYNLQQKLLKLVKKLLNFKYGIQQDNKILDLLQDHIIEVLLEHY
jgi:hypothetical protein